MNQSATSARCSFFHTTHPQGCLSRHTENAWLDANGKVPKSVKIPHKEVEYSIDRRGRVRAIGGGIDWAKLGEATKEEGRYHIGWIWKGSSKGHIVTFERFADGRFRWYDPQNGKTVIFDKAHMAKLSDIKVLRVDNLRINPEVAKDILTRSGAKAKIGGVAADSGVAGKLRVISKEECNYTLPNGGSVSTHAQRLDRGNSGKQEQLKFEKELRMARQYAENGHRVEMLDEIPGIPSPDALIDGLRVDFKSLHSANNIKRHAKDAIFRQGADEVWFEFTTKSDKITATIRDLSKKGIHGRYYFLGENKEYRF